MAADHAPADRGDKAAIVFAISAGNVAQVLRGRGSPRKRGWEHSMCAKDLSAPSSSVKRETNLTATHGFTTT